MINTQDVLETIGMIREDAHRHILQAYIMDNLIIGALQERGIDREIRPDARARKARSHTDGMLLSNGHIKKPLREPLCEGGKSRAVGHGGGNGAKPFLLLCQPAHGVSEGGGET